MRRPAKPPALRPWRIYDLIFDCARRGCNDTGMVRGYTTTEGLDSLGRVVFRPLVDPDQPYYLFPDEILSLEQPE